MFIPITPSRVAQLELAARARHADRGSPLAENRDAVALAAGYSDWTHLEQCARQTVDVGHPDAELPPILAEYLSRAAEEVEVSEAALAAFEYGLVFALDARLLDEFDDLPDDCLPCDEIWPLAAYDAWRVLVNSTEDDDICLAERLDPEALLERAHADLAEWRFYRYDGEVPVASLEQAYAGIFAGLRGAPLFIWLNGAFIDPYRVRETP